MIILGAGARGVGRNEEAIKSLSLRLCFSLLGYFYHRQREIYLK